MARTAASIAGLRRTAARLLPPLQAAPAGGPPVLSVVVPIYLVERYLVECLDSVVTQSYPHLEVLLVDDGSPDGSSEIAAGYAARDPRLRLVRQENAGLGAARNAGAALATGTYLAFLDSDDVLEPDAYRTLVGTLERTGSDFAVGCYCRYDGTRCVPAAAWIREHHARDRLATTLAEEPGALVNAVAWSKVYRRAFWVAQDLRFPVGVLYEDQEVSARAYARARAFDVLQAVTHRWRVRDDRSSITQQVDTATDLRARLAAAQASLAVLDELAGPTAARVRRVQLLSHDLPASVVRAPAADEEFWSVLVAGVRQLTAGVHDEERLQLPPEVRALTHLVEHDLRDDLARFLADGGRDPRRHPSRVEDGQVVVQLPLPPSLPPATRTRLSVLPPARTPLVARLLGARWQDGTHLELAGRARLPGVELGDADVRVRIGLRRDAGPVSWLPLEPGTSRPDRTGDGPADAVDFRAGVDVRELAALLPPGSRAATWAVEVELAVAGLVRSAALAYEGEPADLPGVQVQPSGHRVAPRVQGAGDRRTLLVEVRHVRALARAVVLQDRALAVDLDVAGIVPVQLLAVEGRTGRRRAAPLRRGPAGRWSAAEVLPQVEAGPEDGRSRWLVRVVDDRAREHPVCWPHDLPGPVPDAADPRFWASRTAAGHLRLASRTDVVVVHAARLTDAELLVDVLERGLDGQAPSFVLRGRDAVVVPAQTDRGGGGRRLRFPLPERRSGTSDGALRLVAERGQAAGDTRVVPQVCDPGLLARLPMDPGEVRLAWADGALQVRQGPA